MNPYYYVYRTDETRGPKIKHPTLEAAKAEGERLANQHPGSTFEILKAVAVVRCTVASTFWMDGEAPSKTVEPDVPEHYPPFDLPEGYDRWVYRGLGWKAEQVKYVIWSNKKWDRCAFPSHANANGISDLEYWEAVQDTTKPAYRNLELGESIQAGDEFLDDSASPPVWKARHPAYEEKFEPGFHCPHRRLLTAEESPPPKTARYKMLEIGEYCQDGDEAQVGINSSEWVPRQHRGKQSPGMLPTRRPL